MDFELDIPRTSVDVGSSNFHALQSVVQHQMELPVGWWQRVFAYQHNLYDLAVDPQFVPRDRIAGLDEMEQGWSMVHAYSCHGLQPIFHWGLHRFPIIIIRLRQN